jgi:hypothetical protein
VRNQQIEKFPIKPELCVRVFKYHAEREIILHVAYHFHSRFGRRRKASDISNPTSDTCSLRCGRDSDPNVITNQRQLRILGRKQLRINTLHLGLPFTTGE